MFRLFITRIVGKTGDWIVLYLLLIDHTHTQTMKIRIIQVRGSVSFTTWFIPSFVSFCYLFRFCQTYFIEKLIDIEDK